MAARGAEYKRNKRGPPRLRDQPHCEQKRDRPDVDENSPVIKAFLQYQGELDNKHDKYERLVKLSRDITIDSKRTIFLLQRKEGDVKAVNKLEEADTRLKELCQTKWKQVAMELAKEDPYQYTRAYSAGMQEYVEAVSFHHYLRDQSLVSLQQIQSDLVFQHKAVTEEDSTQSQEKQDQALDQSSKESKTNVNTTEESTISVHVTPMDYMLGIADLTGELMRMAITSIGTGDKKIAFEHCKFMRVIYKAFVSFGNIAKELPRKLSVLRQSLEKVENACYTVQVRGSEFPEDILAQLISTNPGSASYHEDDGSLGD